MNKTAIKNFAIWARRKLIADVSFQAGLAGITESGIASELPQSSGNVKFYDIGTKDPVSISGEKIHMRQRLVDAIREKEKDGSYPDAFRFVVEKVAYTWFNRLIAIRFMEVNDYLPGRSRVLSSENPMKAEPDLVSNPFDADLTFSDQEKRDILRMKDENRLDELFRFLFIRQCHELHKSLPMLFDEEQGIDRKDSYLDLLLNISFTDKDGVLWHLVHDIPEDDFNVEKEGQVEIIGWMYQYYNTDQNELVYDGSLSRAKVQKDLLPAATTIYTPDWVVKYMVHNSLGRLWLDSHPDYDATKLEFLLPVASQDDEIQSGLQNMNNQTVDLTQLRCIDICMGSGHILVHLMETLLNIYTGLGWTAREAIQSIVKNNIYGLDIDDRAAQFAYFAVMMKARQYDRQFLSRGISPNIYAIQESNGIRQQDLTTLAENSLSLPEQKKAISQINSIITSFYNAKEYGSIIQVPSFDYDLLTRFLQSSNVTMQISIESLDLEEKKERIIKLIEQARIFSQQYDIVITNPPYLGSSRFDQKLSDYVKSNFPDTKADLSMVMFESALDRFARTGAYISFVTTTSWMYLSSFEKLRKRILKNTILYSLVDFGTELFDGKVGHNPIVAWVTRKSKALNYNVTGIRLVEYCYSRRDEKQDEFFNPENRYYSHQKNYSKIPGNPIAYWINQKYIDAFDKCISIDNISDYTGSQNKTADNDKYLRYLWEVSNLKIGEGKKWVFYFKGGDYRKHYGNIQYVVDWSEQARLFYKTNSTSNLLAEKYWYQEGITYTMLTSKGPNFRYMPPLGVFDMGGPAICSLSDNIYYVLAFLNSKIASIYLGLFNPTLNLQAKDVKALPLIIDSDKLYEINRIEKECVEVSKNDWDSLETSYDFKHHPLIRNVDSIEAAYNIWVNECDTRFVDIKSKEEELNRQFIDIYNLKDELSAEINDKDVTVRKADLVKDIRSLISYAVGCMFGRYSLDVEGLVYAGGAWDSDKYHTFIPDMDNCIPITDESYFEDDIVGRFVEFIRKVYGSQTLEANLAFIADALGNKGGSSRETIRNYFLNDFFKDHCSTYSVTGSGKRPIYWLFDSGKQNGFKALVYMHRWNADTVGNLRVEYLHRMQRVYEKEIERMQDIIDNSRDNREVNQASKRREKLVKQLKEARDYDAKIAHVALSRVEIDLDDGVKVNYEKVQKGSDGKSLGILAKI